MKVTFIEPIKFYSGKIDGLVFYRGNPIKDVCIARRHAAKPYDHTNKKISDVSKQLKALAPSQAYKDDLSRYVFMMGPEGYNMHWRNTYLKMMYRLARLYNVDLLSLTREDIPNLPVRTVKDAVEAGLLKPYPGYQYLNAEF